MKTVCTSLLTFVLLLGGCSTEMQKRGLSDEGSSRNRSGAGGFWEGSSLFIPSYYYGFTFVEWRGQLLGTCFQGGPDVRVYYLERCTIQGNHFKGWKSYVPANLSEAIEGTFEGNSCRLVEYYTDGRAVINLHRVAKLSRMPNVFREPVEKKD